MFLFELTNTESHPAYQALEAENLDRQYTFLRSIVTASVSLDHTVLSIELVKALNYHAISGLHVNAGEFRPCPVTVGPYTPPEHYRVSALMQMFTNDVNANFAATDPIALAAYVLWKINQIHPFINGNGRTARAACYMVLCMRAGGWLPGSPILPELIRRNRPAYVEALRAADASAQAGVLNLGQLHTLLEQLLNQQMNAAAPPLPPAS